MVLLKRIGSGLLLMVLASLLTGCGVLFVGAAASSVAGALYYKGELKADVEASPQAVITATEKAFRDLIWAKETASASEFDGLATDASDTLIAWYRPARMFMRVDLPAPFSPGRAWTSHVRRSKSTWSLATTPGKRLTIPRISTARVVSVMG